MGYEKADKRVKRMMQFQSTQHPSTAKRRRKVSVNTSDMAPNDIASDSPIIPDPEDIELPKHKPYVPWIVVLLAMYLGLWNTVVNQRQEIKKLKAEIAFLEVKNRKLRNNAYSEKILQSDSDVNFLTGIATKSLFLKFHSLIAQFVTRRWHGVVSMAKNIRKFKTQRYGPEMKLTSKSEFLLMLMKLRLGLLNKDLAKRFDISETLCSRIFFTWLRVSSKVLRGLLYVPDEESLIGSKPHQYRKLQNLHSIVDCTEIFIETPKDPYLQSATWSDYKHHNTLKVFVSCAPNSSSIFISDAYLGRLSDKKVTLEVRVWVFGHGANAQHDYG